MEETVRKSAMHMLEMLQFDREECFDSFLCVTDTGHRARLWLTALSRLPTPSSLRLFAEIPKPGSQSTMSHKHGEHSPAGGPAPPASSSSSSSVSANHSRAGSPPLPSGDDGADGSMNTFIVHRDETLLKMADLQTDYFADEGTMSCMWCNCCCSRTLGFVREQKTEIYSEVDPCLAIRKHACFAQALLTFKHFDQCATLGEIAW